LTRSVVGTVAFGAAATVLVVALAFGVDRTASRAPIGSIDAQLAAARNRSYACFNTRTPSGIDYCVGGDGGSAQSVLLVGDSHAGVWTNALVDVAQSRGLQMLVRVSRGCPATPVLVEVDTQGQLSQEQCEKAHEDTMALIEELRPSAVIVTQSYAYLGKITDGEGDAPTLDRQTDLWADAHSDLLRAIRTSGSAVGVIYDVPTLPEDPIDCIARERAVVPCEPDRSEALSRTRPLRDAEREATEGVGDVPAFDPIPDLCNRSTCLLELDGAIAYSDTNHLTDSATFHLRPRLNTLLDQLLR
jgi:hypothetical protein